MDKFEPHNLRQFSTEQSIGSRVRGSIHMICHSPLIYIILCLSFLAAEDPCRIGCTNGVCFVDERGMKGCQCDLGYEARADDNKLCLGECISTILKKAILCIY